ncbi:taste receptor, type 2, member 202 [Genypterus blacodes]|uniref:taste receptor, type 2, member 202 n=1 Tax=Genypterus blacodes TaxID=154954 RepID=UPI003F761B40
MLGANKLIIWALTGVLAVTTVFFNLYIVLANLWNHKEKSPWSPSDIIITALSASSGAHQLLCYFWMTMDELDRECRMAQTPYSVMLLLIFSLKFTIMWNTSFLTSHYSHKLVTTANPCNMKIHATIIKHVTLVVFLIPLLGLAFSMPMLAVLHHDNDTRANEDCGVMVPDTPAGQVYEAMNLILADVLPGVVMIKCCVSISVHLGVHLLHMKASSTDPAHRPRLGAQIRVVQMTLSLVAVFLCFLVVDLYVHSQIALAHENAIVLTFFFTSLYTTVTAVVLLYGRKPLWKALIPPGCLERPCLSFLKAPDGDSKPSAQPETKA